jgi:acetylornithine aminotransferase
LPNLTNVVVLNTLSKRSSMTGYRSGFAAGDPT